MILLLVIQTFSLQYSRRIASTNVVIIPDETIMTVRAIDRCAKDRLQTLARIIFVDSMIDYPTKFDYYEPFQPNAQSYDSLNYPKIVSSISS